MNLKWVLLGIACGVASALGVVIGLAFYAIAKDAGRHGWPEPPKNLRKLRDGE